jgi:hypothetical protein
MIAAVAAVPAQAIQSAAQAAPSTEASDARCLAVLSLIVASGDKETLQAAQTGSFIFVGKLLGRNPSIDLEAAMRTASAAMGENTRPDLVRCGAEITAIGQTMSRVGEALQKPRG